MRRILILLLSFAVVFLAVTPADAHISHRSQYKPGVDGERWTAISNIVFATGQLLGLAYFAAVLHAYRCWPVWRTLLVALCCQSVIAVVLFVIGVVTFSIVLWGFTSHTQILPSGIETALLLDPPRALAALAGTLAVGVGQRRGGQVIMPP
jgi:hypothetical protein